jgi:hypothetical protein
VPMQSQEVICGGRYLSSDEPIRVFAAGSLTNDMRIEVKWRSRQRSVIYNVRANRLYEIAEGAAHAIDSVPTSAVQASQVSSLMTQQGTDLRHWHPTARVKRG